MRRLVRREHPVGWGVLAAILTLAVIASALGSGSTPVHAQAGVLPLPADQGSVWSIVAGYNTGSHFGNDPHAIDIVREDAETTGSTVRAPISGTISFVSTECLTINHGDGLAVLLCHIFPNSGLQRGVSVRVGDALGTVAPAFFASNGGLPHIHLAVHHTAGSGLIQGTIPLTGGWALEGIDLPWTGEFNAHAGTRFVSSNGRNPAPAPAPAPQPAPEEAPPDPGIDEGFSLQVLQPGWNSVGWTARTSAAEVAAALGDGGGVLFTFDAAGQQFRRFASDAPTAVNDLTVLEDGDGVLIYVEDPKGAVLPRPPFGEARRGTLYRGFNLVAWTGAPATIEEASRSLGEALVAAFAWDAPLQRYRVFRPGQPLISDLESVEPGQALWLLLDANAVWDPLAQGPVAPPPDDPPPDDPPPEDEPEIAPPDAGLAQVVGPVCLNLRPAPTTIGTTPITCLAAGTVLELLGPTAVDATGRAWTQVRVLGLTGWVATEFTIPFDPETIEEGGNGGVGLEGPPGDTPDGVASFYHPSLAGNPMYCGGVYNPNDPTIAASTTYDCGTRLRVWRGNVFVDVVVQDTGLLPANHIDLSASAYNQLGLPAEGIIPVRIELLALPGE